MNINKAKSIRKFIQALIRARFMFVPILLLALPLLLLVPGSPVQAQSPELTQWYCPYCKSWYAMNASCPHTSGGSSGGGSSPHSQNSSTKAIMQKAIVNELGKTLEKILNDKPDQAKEAAELKRQHEAAQAKEAAEQAANLKANLNYGRLQLDSLREKSFNQEKGQSLLPKMNSSGGSAGQLAPMGPGAFQWDKPRTDLALMPAGSVAAPTNAFGQLQAAAGLSKDAAEAANADQARMLAGQAGLVMPGGATSIQAPLAQLPVPPPVPKPAKVDQMEEVKLKIKADNETLQKLEAQKKELEAEKRVAEKNGQQAKDMFEQVKELRSSNKPEDKQNADALERAAKELENNVNQQLTKVDQDSKTLNDQIGRTQDELKNDNATLQNVAQGNGAARNSTESMNRN